VDEDDSPVGAVERRARDIEMSRVRLVSVRVMRERIIFSLRFVVSTINCDVVSLI